MCAMTVPIEKRFFESMADLKSSSRRVGWVADRASGGSWVDIHETLCWPSTSEFLVEACLQSCLQGREEDMRGVYDKTWQLCQTFSGQLACSALMWRTPPWSFLGLLAESADSRAACVARLQSEYRTLMEVESIALENPGAVEWLRELHVGEQVFVREIFVRLEELRLT
eukprot:6460802-Amphidinium_carterae.3